MSIRRLKKSFYSDTLAHRLDILTDFLICSNFSNRLVWETTVPKILVAGQDIHLLGTRAAVLARIPTITTLAAAHAAAEGITALQNGKLSVVALQTLHSDRIAAKV